MIRLCNLMNKNIRERAYMKYINANKVLPDYLVSELQQYAQGSYLYVPVKDGQHKDWGELSGYRAAIAERNEQILLSHQNGASVKELSELYFLSQNAIRKIIKTNIK